MPKVRDKIRIYRGEECVEVTALFDTGATRSYLNDEVAERLGYEPYPEPVRVPLAVEGKYADVVGRLHVYLEIVGYRLPEEETIGVIKDLREEAIIGLNIIESYGIVFEKDRIRFRRTPPTAYLI